jgi:hypothetical protein
MSTPVSVLRRPLNRRGSRHYGDKANIVKAAFRQRGERSTDDTLEAPLPVNLFTT